MKTTAIYLRVSTLDQEKGIRSQEKALREYVKAQGLPKSKWYRDRLSGSTTDRPVFTRLQRDIFSGRVGTVVCWRLDRLSRSLRDGINILCDWCDRGIRIVSVSQQLDFNGTTGQLIASVLFAVAQMERENLRENTKRGLAAAKARGVKLGKRPRLFAKDILPLRKSGMTVTEIAKKFGKSRQAIYDALKRG